MKLFIYCAGGFGKEVMDSVKKINEAEGRWDDISFIDDNESLGNEFYNTKVFTFKELLEKSDLNSFEVSIANGDPFVRKEIYNKLIENNVKTVSLIDKTAIISNTAIMGECLIILAHCFVSSSAKIGNNVALNTNTLIGHDTVLSDNCVASSAVNIGGNCFVGENSYVGMGSQIKQGVTIGKGVIIGMGSVVYNDIPDGVIALGNPARPMKANQDKKVFKK
jgi:sugar O-acyltransferase (sialic acid O-acetyltransferase NeuD family)